MQRGYPKRLVYTILCYRITTLEEPSVVAGSGWSEQEIIASVDALVRMPKMQQSGSPFVKAEIVRTLRAYKLSVRSRSSVEMRFMNLFRVENTTLKTADNIFYRIKYYILELPGQI